MLSSEASYALYVAIRDGDVAAAAAILRLPPPSSNNSQVSTSGDDSIKKVDVQPLDVNTRVFESLWHEPGPEATCLHLAACCGRPNVVRWLLSLGARKDALASGKSAAAVINCYDAFAPMRAQRPHDFDDVRELLRD